MPAAARWRLEPGSRSHAGRARGPLGGGDGGGAAPAGRPRAASVAPAAALLLVIAAASALALAPSLGVEAYAQTFAPPPPSLVPTLQYLDERVNQATTLRNVDGIDTFTLLNGDTHVIAAVPGGNDASGNGIWRIRVFENADFGPGITPVGDSVFDGNRNFTALRNAVSVEAFTLINGSTFAMVASTGDNGVQLVHVLENGTLVAAGTAINGAQDANGDTYDRLAAPVKLDVFTLGNNERYALVVSSGPDSVQLIHIDRDGTMYAADSAFTTGNTGNLRNAQAVTAFDLLDGNTYALVAGDSTRISLLGVSEEGTLSAPTAVENGARGFDALYSISDMVSFTLRNGSTYALASTYGGSGVQLIRVHENGSVTGADSLTGSEGGFPAPGSARGATAVDAFEMDGDTYALALSRTQTGQSNVHLIRVHEDGTLELITSQYHGLLRIPNDITAFTLRDGSMHAAATFGTNNDIHLFNITLPAPSVRYVSSAYADGSYTADDDVHVTVVFDGRVYVGADDQPKLLMSTGRNATYYSGNGTTALTFRYDVQESDQAVLDHDGTDALAGTIANYLGVSADLELPMKGSGNTLGEQKMLVADGRPPSVESVSSTYDDMYGPHAITDPGAIVPITVEFDEAVFLYEGSSAPTLELAVGTRSNGMAVYASGNGSSTLVFNYVVREGDKSLDLNYTGTGALSLNGGSIRDAAGHAPDGPLLPDPDMEGSLGASEAIMIDTSLSPPPSTVRPSLTSIQSLFSSGDYETLTRVRGLDAFTLLNGDTYIIAAASGPNVNTNMPNNMVKDGDAVQLIRVHENATLELKDWAKDGDPGFEALNRSAYVDAFKLRNGSTYAMVSAGADSHSDDDGVQLIRVHEDGTLQGAGSLRDASDVDLVLDNPRHVNAFTLRNGDTYALVSSKGDSGVQVIRVQEDGTMAPAGSVNTTTSSFLLNENRVAVAFALRNGGTYALTGGQGSGGVVMYHVQEGGVLAEVGTASNGVTGSNDLAVFTMRNGSTYALSASNDGDAVHLIRVHTDGSFGAVVSASHADPDFTLRNPRAVDTFALDGDTYALVGVYGDGNGGNSGAQLIRVHEDGTLDGIDLATLLTYRTQSVTFPLRHNTDVVAFTLRNGATYAAVASTTQDTVELLGISMPTPSLLRVIAAGGNGTYYGNADISVVFDGRVYINSSEAMPVLQLAGGRSAAYHSGNGTTALTFRYVVQQGEQAVLYQQTGTSLGGLITNYLGAEVDTMRPMNGSGNTLGERNEVRVDGTVARVLSVSSAATGPVLYGPGETIPITVTFSRSVTVTPATHIDDSTRPYILLETGQNSRATYAEGSGSTELVFNYTVQDNDLTGDLDYQGDIVVPAGASITDIASGEAARPDLPPAGSGDSLADRASIGIDGVRPSVVSVNSSVADKAYGIGARIDVQVEFDETVVVTGLPRVPLGTGDANAAGFARYIEGSNSDTLVFEYEVRENDETADLDHGDALLLNGGTIEDGIGNAAVLDLSALDNSGLGDLKNIKIDGVRPRVDSVTSYTDDGPYGINASIDVRVEFSKVVTVDNSTGNPTVPLDTGGAATYISVTGGDTLVFEYVVARGDNTANLDHGNALLLNGGNITDSVGNTANLGLPDPSPDNNRLGESKRIKIDTVPPAVTLVEAVARNGLSVSFGEPVVSGGEAYSAGWSISGDDAGSLSVAEAPAPLSPAQDKMTLTLDGDLPDTSPDIKLSYDQTLGGIRDEAGNAMASAGDLDVVDRIEPTIVGDAALITEDRQVSIEYTEPVSARQGAYGSLLINGVPRAISPYGAYSDAPATTHDLGFAGEAAPHAASGTMSVDAEAVRDGAGEANSLAGEHDGTLAVYDGRTLMVITESTIIRGGDTAVITYTRPATAPQGAYTSLVVDGQARNITSLAGGDGDGSRTHTITFTPPGAPPDAAGSVTIDGTAVRSGEDRLEDGRTVRQDLRDGQEPSVRSATAVSLGTIRVVFDEAVVPGAGAAGWSVSGGDAEGRAVASVRAAQDSTDALVLVLDADLPDTGPDSITLSYSPADGGASDAAGNGLGSWNGPVGDGIDPMVGQARILVGNTAEVWYTERVWAGPGAYVSVSLDSGGDPRPVTGLGGNGSAVHRIAFGGEATSRDETGNLTLVVSAVRDGAGNLLDADSPLSLADAQPPSVRSATAVSLSTIRVVFDKPVSAPGAGAAGWSVSGGDAAGISVASSEDVPEASPSEVLVLTLSARLPDTAPDNVVLSYDPAAGGNVQDAAGNALEEAPSVPVADGIAPAIVPESSIVSGPNEAVVRYTEPVRAGADAYASVWVSSGGGPRMVSGLDGNETITHTVAFEGAEAAPGATGILEVNEAAVRDASMNLLGTDGMRRVELGGRAPSVPTAGGNDTASVLSAVFTARNEATITYSGNLAPPAGYDGAVYSVSVYGEDADRAVTAVRGLDRNAHTVVFGGAGVDRGQNGTITLEVGLEGTGGRIAAGATIPVAPGAAVQAVLVLPPPQGETTVPVVIEPRGFTRIVDATPSGGSARLAINVSGLAVAPDDGSDAPGTAVFPDDEAVTLSATFAEVTFPPGVTATSVPADGAIVLRVSEAEPPSDADVAEFLDYEGAGELALRPVIIEAGDDRMPVIFDKPVRILLAGQAMGRAFYINASSGGTADAQIAPIDKRCAADSAQRVDVQLGGAGECQLDSGDDKVVYTYHMTRFGTVSGSGAPPPDGRECSVRLVSDGTGMAVVAGQDYSSAVARGVVNSGSETFDAVGIESEPWMVGALPGANATSLPANSTSMSLDGTEGSFAPLPASGTYVAQGRDGGTVESLWFMLNMTGRELPIGSELAQVVTYTASCSG